MTRHYIVHYGELGLKGHNRIDFERRLVTNIGRALEDLGHPEVRRFHSYIMVTVSESVPGGDMEARLQRIPGIAYFAPVTTAPPELEAIAATAVSLADGIITPETSFRVKTTRGDKTFPMISPQVDREIGARIVQATRAPVNLTSPDVTLSIQIYGDSAYLFVRRIPGMGGLPVGSSGRALVLFSGGIDSPVAAHLMMKRGCAVDFVHFHLLSNRERIHSAKIVAMARQVLTPHRAAGRLYMVSAAPFEAAMTAMDSRVATVVFRRFIMRAAERLSRRRKALALITGESLGQVASQTLKNIGMINRATQLPILRPLISMDKEEIVSIAKDIGTYELSIEPYQDPCSLHARHPATWARLADVSGVESAIDVASLLEETLAEHVEEIHIGFARH